MDLQLALEHRTKVEEFTRKHRIGLLTLLFTDIVGSTQLKQDLGEVQAVALLQWHRQEVRDILSRFQEAEEIETAGDSFFIVFAKPSEAVKFALLVQCQLRVAAHRTRRGIVARIGIHIGEVFIEEHGEGRKARDLYGLQVDIGARVMSLAEGDQILLSRSAFDNARQVLKGQEIEGLNKLNRLNELQWLNHGLYLLKGVEEPMEICEVGETGAAILKPPPDSDKVRRHVSPDGEPVLGWRPAIDQVMPGTEWALVEKLGEGGFGEVWLGVHRILKEKRVFKFCFRADRVRSLKREVTIFRLLRERLGSHLNIVAVQDVYLNEPPFYLTMEYVGGRDLRSWVESQGGIQNVSISTRLEIAAQIADALQVAHDAGVIHRDVKPSNILIRELRELPRTKVEMSEDSRGLTDGIAVQAKLSDFGIGQVVSEEVLAGVTRLGFTETMLPLGGATQAGTYLYMAPELFAGQPASKQSDVYSLGVVLYQLLVGDFSLPLTTDWAKGVEDPVLRGDVAKCIAGRREDRFQSAAALAGILRSLDQRRAGRVLEEALQRAEEEACRRQIAEEQNRRLQAACDQARRADEKAQIEAEVRNDTSQENRFDHLVASTVALAATSGILNNELAEVLGATEHQALIFLSMGQTSHAASLEAQVVETSKRVLGPEHPDTLASMNNLGVVYRWQGKLVQAATQHAQVLETQKRVLGPEHPITLASMDSLALVYHDQGKYSDAATLHSQVLEVRKRVLGPEHPETLASMNDLALVYHAQGNLGDAATLHAQVMEIRKRVLGPKHRNTLASMDNLAFVYRAQGKQAEAATLHAQVLGIKKHVLGFEHSATLTSVDNLAAVYEAQGKLVEAATLHAQVLEIRKRVLASEHPATLTSMSNLATVYQAQGKLVGAATLYAEVLEIQKRVLGLEHSTTLRSMNSLALVCQGQDKLVEAATLHTQVLEIRKRMLGDEHPDTLTSMSNLANVYRTQGKYGEAETLHAQVLEIRKCLLGAEHPDTLLSMMGLTVVYHTQGKLTEAETLRAQMLEIQRRVLGPEHPEALISMNSPVAAYQAQHQKLAALLVLLGEESASSLLNLIEEHDGDLVAAEIDKLPPLTLEQQTAVLKEFTDMALSTNATLRGSVEYTRGVLEKAVGVVRAAEIIGRIEIQQTSVTPKRERRTSADTVHRIVNELPAAKSKLKMEQAVRSELEMEFGIVESAPERITLAVLKQLIRDIPVKMSQAAGNWLRQSVKDKRNTEKALSHLQKLATLLILLGEDGASILLKNFEEHERELIAAEIATLPIINLAQQTAVLKEFTELALLKEFDLRLLKPRASGAEVPEPPAPSNAARPYAHRQVEPIISPEQQEAKELEAAKSKLVKDFGLGQQAPERITIGVLKQLIQENPMKLSQAARVWLRPKSPGATK